MYDIVHYHVECSQSITCPYHLVFICSTHTLVPIQLDQLQKAHCS